MLQKTGVTFEDLAEYPPEDDLPFLDRREGVEESKLNADQREWRNNGLVIKEGFIPKELTDAYIAARAHLGSLMGYPDAYAYMRVPELRAICCYKPLADLMSNLMGEEMLPHFDLTQWISTERNWHQDDYLNEEYVNAHYAAVWFALDKIDPDAGPFQYAPTSNRWPVVRRGKVMAQMTPEEAMSPRWPIYSEKIVVPAYEEKLRQSGLPTQYFLANRGDTLVWHGRLLHRGTAPKKPNTQRRSAIVHYTGMSRLKPELHEVRRTPEGAPYIWHKFVSPDFPQAPGW